MAACLVYVLNGKVENTLLDFKNAGLEIISKTTKISGDFLYLNNRIIHYMENTGNENLICLHVYQSGISEMKVFDEQNKNVYTLSGRLVRGFPQKRAIISWK
jgi:hypothetical protein